MSFRCRQKLRLANYKPVIMYEQETLESGEVIAQATDLTKEHLPNPELFDINNQIKAGVDMEEVNSKVLKPSKVDVNTVVRKYTRKPKNVDTDN